MISGAGTIARAEIRDGLRRRRQLVIRALTPLVLLGFLVALSAIGGGDRVAGDTYTVAVSGAVDEASELIATLDAQPRLTIEQADDPALAAAEETDAAIVFAPGADRAWERGDRVDLVVYSSVSERNSNAAAALAESVLTRDWRDRELEAVGESSRFDVQLIDIVTTPEGARSTVGQVVAALVLLQAVVLVGGAAARFGGRQVGGTLTAQLLLPLRRHELLLGKGLSESTVGLAASAPILALITLVGVVAALVDGGPLGAGAALVAIALTAAAVSFLAVTVGLVIGVTSRSSEQSSLYSAFAIVFVAVVVNAFVLGEPKGDVFAVIPVAGSAKALREVIGGTGDPVVLAVATASTVLLGLLLIRLAARKLDAERLAMRST